MGASKGAGSLMMGDLALLYLIACTNLGDIALSVRYVMK